MSNIIQANELRIGNWVQRIIQIDFSDYKDPKYAQIDPVMIRDCMHYRDNWAFEPIPLTPEILEKAGFGVPNDLALNPYCSTFCKVVGDFTISILFDVDGEIQTEIGDNIGSISTRAVVSLHQLQNLYFALTGKELLPNEPNYD